MTALSDRYAIERELGQGGMATVYLASDLRHDRRVAVKVLRPELAAVIGAERFLAEIKTTAGLQHPHILALHDSGEADGFLFYVMPFIEGESLRDRLNHEKQLPVETAVRIATEVAGALDYAHRHGVIHRDIKPENILLHDGSALVADFGIALAVSTAGGGRLTETGMSLGTPHYMSPEQAMGEREISARSDVYALGCVLYEMLAGEPPFTGPTAQAIVARVMTEEPRSLTLQRKTIPLHLEAAVQVALAKLPADRFESAAAFAEALRNPAFAPPQSAGGVVAAVHPVRRAMHWPWPAAVAAAALLGGALGWRLRPLPSRPPERYHVFEGLALTGDLAVSPDGRTIVATAADKDGTTTLVVRRLDQVESRPLAGTENAYFASFSPDGGQLVFGVGNGLKRVALSGSPPVTVTNSGTFGLTASWGADDYIYFTDRQGAISRVPASGGAIEGVTSRDTAARASKGAMAHPVLLPNRRGLLVTIVHPTEDEDEVAVVDLKSGAVRTLTKGLMARYDPSGGLVYATAGGTLYAVPFDADRMVISGTPRPIAQEVAQLGAWGYTFYGLSDNGVLVYQTGGAQGAVPVSLALVGRDGHERLLPVPRDKYGSLSLSPDGRRLAVDVWRGSSDGGDIFVMSLNDSVLTRLTFEGVNSYPAWTPDGRRVAFGHEANGERDLYWKPADGTGKAEPIFQRPRAQFEVDFSRDGRWLVFREGNGSTIEQLVLGYATVDPPGQQHIYLNEPNPSQREPRLSPDGRWLAYVANDPTGRPEVYVRPFPDAGSGAVWQVSTDGGLEPVWAHSGRELFYKAASGLTAAEVTTTPSFAVRGRHTLFSVARYLNNPFHARYDVLPGDQAFVMIRNQTGEAGGAAVIVLNWRTELETAPAR